MKYVAMVWTILSLIYLAIIYLNHIEMVVF